mgnify:CR=1 FL=1
MTFLFRYYIIQNMDSILILSDANSTLEIISELTKVQAFSRIVTTKDCSEARIDVAQHLFDLIIIDIPSFNESISEFIFYILEQTDSGLIILVDEESSFTEIESFESAGAFIISKPVNVSFLSQTIKFIGANKKRLSNLENENQKLQQKIEEIRLVDRAKCVLIQYLNMTEPQAHRYITKQSMDLRQSRLVTAENILKTYES